MKTFYALLNIVILFNLSGCAKKEISVNIYDSNEYKSLTNKQIILGESIWATACFRCHRRGINGAVILEEKEYWDKAAAKGTDELFNSVWEGYKGENGVMPPKGFYNLGSKDEIRTSVLYLFYLAKKAQAANEINSNLEGT